MERQSRHLREEVERNNRKQTLRIFFGRGVIVKLCAALLILFVLVAIFAKGLMPYDPNKQNVLQAMQEGSAEHILGTDNFGRDIFSRLIYGTRVSLFTSFLASTASAVVGVLLGLVAGYFQGLAGNVIMRAMDIILSIPNLVFTLIIAIIMDGGLVSLVIAIGFGMIPTYVRMMYGLVISMRENDYIVAARILGQKESAILFRHLLPNAFPSLIVLYTINLGSGVMTESSLSYLGVGITPPTATWGSMVSNAYLYLTRAPMMAIIPGICIIVLTIAFNVVGDALRDALDPRLRGKL